MADDEIVGLLARFDDLLDRIEAMPGPTTDLALDAIGCLTEIYGEALRRIMAALGTEALGTEALGTQVSLRGLAGDELVGHLLALHGLHPDTAEQRIAAALDDARRQIGQQADVSLTSIDDGVAHVEVVAGGCSSSALASSIGDVVLAAAPELAGVESVAVQPPPVATLIPIDAVLAHSVGAKNAR